jgi:hypothetical protein
MSLETKIIRSVGANDSMSTAAASAALNAETRAFGNAIAKLNLQHATAAFAQAKKSFEVQTSHGTESLPKGE